jgi:hypothetical protein
MGSVATLPLSNVVDVSVMISPIAPATPTFNQGLIVGTSPVIPSVIGSAPRIRQYTTLAQVAADGFGVNTPEYIAAQIYFSQNANGPAPLYLWIGRQDLTALATLTLGAVPGTGYAVGDTGLVVQGGATLGQYTVVAETAGVPTSVVIVPGSQGTGYAIANNLSTTVLTGSGNGALEVDITAVGETPLQAVQACRVASSQWYLVVALAAVDADHIAIGEWAQAITPQLVYFYTTGTAASANGTAGNVFTTLKNQSISRAFGIYSTVQGGLAPNNIYAAVAAMGVAMGLNTGLAGSYFTMKFKELVGIVAENTSLGVITSSQISTVENNGGNLYLSYGNSYTWLEQGVVANGQFFDEILNLDMLASDMQFSCVDLLTENGVITQTTYGQTQLINVCNGACSRSAARGFLAGGIWDGVQILNLAPGQSVPNGYLSQSPAANTQSAADRQARKALPIYVAIIEAGAIHSLIIGVYVQQ